MVAPAGRDRPRHGRAARRDRHRHGIRARAWATSRRCSARPREGAATPGRSGRDGDLPRAHQGARRRPARPDRGAGRARGAGRDLRRRHPARRAALDPRPRQRRAHQPRPAAPLAAARARAVVAVPAVAASTSSSTSATSTAGCSARTSRRCCAGCAGSPPATAPRPTFVLASATVSRPATHASRLIGMPVAAVTDDGSPRGAMTFALWEPGDRATATGRSATTEAAEILAELVLDGVQAVAFARSRAGAEALATNARRRVEHDDPARAEGVAAYRGGYLPQDRRELERGLRDGSVRGLAATNALELGIDVSGLDAVVMAGWPGRRASLWQQAGRAGRSGEESLAVLVAADDPLDTYLVRHPEAVFGAAGRGDRHGPAQPPRAGPAPRGRRGRAAPGRGRPADVRPRRPAAARRARGARHPAAPAVGVVLGARGPARRAHLAARGERRRGGRRGPHRSRARHRRRGRRRTPRCTPGRCTCTRATRGSSPSSTSRRAPPTSCAATPAGRRTPSR